MLPYGVSVVVDGASDRSLAVIMVSSVPTVVSMIERLFVDIVDEVAARLEPLTSVVVVRAVSTAPPPVVGADSPRLVVMTNVVHAVSLPLACSVDDSVTCLKDRFVV